MPRDRHCSVVTQRTTVLTRGIHLLTRPEQPLFDDLTPYGQVCARLNAQLLF